MNRHEYRVNIVIALYQSLLLKKDLRVAFDDNFEGDENEFFVQIKEDLIKNENEYIEIVSSLLHNWSFDRLSYVDQAILLAATSEFKLGLNSKNIIIDEAINIAKKYSDEESYKYINGVLDKLA